MSSNIFNCCKESNLNPLEDFNSYMEGLTNQLDEEVYIHGQIYQTDIILEEVDIVVRLIRKNWCYVQNIVLNNSTISHDELLNIREEITKCLKLIIKCLKYCDSDVFKAQYLSSTLKHLKAFSSLVVPVGELEESIYLKLFGSSHAKDRCPIYQYFHTYLDIQYYLLLLDHVSGNTEEFTSHVTFLMKDLITISEKNFKQNSKCAFVCNCIKNIWLIIQFLCEKILGEDSFWPIFNKAVDSYDSKYVLWILQDVGNLQAIDINGKFIGCLSERIKPNFTLLESSLKVIVAKGDFNNSILLTLKAVEPLVCSLWLKSSKIEVYQILWEYFSKRLNTSARTSKNFTMVELVELIDKILWTPKDCEEDFELFLSMLSTHLNEHPHHWGKMKGRIYSQLGPNKIKDLNNNGLFNVSLLFISLTKVNFEELPKKFMSFIENLPTEKRRSQLIWSFYTSFFVRHVRENRSIEAVTAPFIKMLEEGSSDQKLFPLIKTFVTDFDNIMKLSANLQLHQWVLINSWIHNYMTSCYHPDLVVLLSVLLNAIELINTEQIWYEWESPFKNYVYPTLKYVANSRSAPEACGTLAAKIAVLCPSLLAEAFTFFNSESIVPKVSSNFLCVILASCPNSFMLSSQQEIVALQSWIKICLLTRDSYEELTRNIIKLDVIPSFIKTEIATAGDPLCAFIDCIALNIKQHVQSIAMNKFCENCFGHVERWITQYFTQPDNEATVLRIYTCMSLAFYKIGPLLYNKHKVNCPYTRLVSSILLPTEIMIGKTLNPYILQGIKKTWHLFFGATIKLNTSNDPFIERTLRELVVKYIPHFAISDSPMLKCLDNETIAEVILDKMSNAFFKQPTKEAESNIFKSLRIINDFVQGTTSAPLIKLIVDKTLYGIFEVVMFHSQRNVALTIVKNITSSSLYPQVKTEFEEIIITITEKHLAFNTPNYFQLMGLLAKFIPTGLKSLMPRIKKQISNVERMRGVGFDKNLRLNLEKLEATLLQM